MVSLMRDLSVWLLASGCLASPVVFAQSQDPFLTPPIPVRTTVSGPAASGYANGGPTIGTTGSAAPLQNPGTSFSLPGIPGVVTNETNPGGAAPNLAAPTFTQPGTMVPGDTLQGTYPPGMSGTVLPPTGMPGEIYSGDPMMGSGWGNSDPLQLVEPNDDPYGPRKRRRRRSPRQRQSARPGMNCPGPMDPCGSAITANGWGMDDASCGCQAGPFPGAHSPCDDPCGADPCGIDSCGGRSGRHPWIDFRVGLDTFRGIADQGTSNLGLLHSVNVGIPILDEFGLGFQVGGSYGVYDWSGRPTPAGPGPGTGVNNSQSQQQGFMTLGFYRQGTADRPLTFGLVYDFMFNSNFGAFADEPRLGQWRALAAYAFSDSDEVGVWGAWSERRAQQGGIPPNQYRIVSQVNLFWHHKFAQSQSDSWIYIGVPERTRLDGTQNGSLGEFVAGGSLLVPMSDRTSVYIDTTYMKASADAGVPGFQEDSYHLGAGLVFTWGGQNRGYGFTDQRWRPVMPIANNGSMLVDFAR